MALSINFSTNTKNIQKKFDKFLRKFPHITRKGLDQAGEQLIEIIRTKTTRGEKYTSGKFPRYSDEYSALKGKTVVDLQDTNRMLQSIKSRTVNNFKNIVYFGNQQMALRAYWHQTGSGNLPERPFFGFNKKVENVIKKQFENLISKEMKRMKL